MAFSKYQGYQEGRDFSTKSIFKLTPVDSIDLSTFLVRPDNQPVTKQQGESHKSEHVLGQSSSKSKRRREGTFDYLAAIKTP